MKKLLCLTTILILTISLFGIGEITFDNLKHNYGSIEEDNGPYEHLFKFVNTGDQPFKLIKVKAG